MIWINGTFLSQRSWMPVKVSSSNDCPEYMIENAKFLLNNHSMLNLVVLTNTDCFDPIVTVKLDNAYIEYLVQSYNSHQNYYHNMAIITSNIRRKLIYDYMIVNNIQDLYHIDGDFILFHLPDISHFSCLMLPEYANDIITHYDQDLLKDILNLQEKAKMNNLFFSDMSITWAYALNWYNDSYPCYFQHPFQPIHDQTFGSCNPLVVKSNQMNSGHLLRLTKSIFKLNNTCDARNSCISLNSVKYRHTGLMNNEIHYQLINNTIFTLKDDASLIKVCGIHFQGNEKRLIKQVIEDRNNLIYDAFID
jgi:hypothetical protein